MECILILRTKYPSVKTVKKTLILKLSERNSQDYTFLKTTLKIGLAIFKSFCLLAHFSQVYTNSPSTTSTTQGVSIKRPIQSNIIFTSGFKLLADCSSRI